MSRNNSGGIMRAYNFVGIYVGLISLFLGGIFLAYSLPPNSIFKNIQQSAQTLTNEGEFLVPPFVYNRAFLFDNDTEAIMLDLAIRQSGESLAESALAPKKNGPDAAMNGNAVTALQEVALSGVRPRPQSYSYYWHGYQTILRPALVFFTYESLRYLNLIVLAVLGLIVFILIKKRAGAIAAVSFYLSMLLTGMYVVPMQLGYSVSVHIMLVSLIFILLVQRKFLDNFALEIFFVIGMCTSYFEFLMAPLLTLGIPLAILMCIRNIKSEESFLAQLKNVIGNSLFWCLGYVSSWLAKVVIGSVVLKQDVWSLFVGQFITRSGLNPAYPAPWASVVMQNLQDIFPLLFMPTMYIIFVCALVILAIVFPAPRGTFSKKSGILLLIPFPFLWFALASQHSQRHHYYTYRILAIAIFAILYLAISLINWKRVGKAIRLDNN